MLLDAVSFYSTHYAPMASPFEARILITGGAGYLGRGIMRYIERNRIGARVTVYSRDEQKHYAVRSRFPYGVQTILGDINDIDRLTAAMTGHDVVIHAAAMKHVPEAERDVAVAFQTNVLGSQNVAYAAMRAGVRKVVGISTDKVCSPRNTYGATKMLMERTFQEAQRMAPHVRFVNVRYGNVISSTGSVVPLFRDQFRKHGRVSITSPEMTRFWLPIDDAVQLVERALADDSRHGHTYIAQCPAMSIVDVAKAVWLEENGHAPMPDYEVIGVRPGEKLHETLLDPAEAPFALPTHDGLLVIPPALGMTGEGTSTLRPYSSDNPNKWLTPGEFRDLIQDADTV